MSAPRPQFPPGYAEENLGSGTIVVAVIFIILEITAVALRFAARFIYRSKWGTDDYLIVPALFFALGMCAICIVEVKIAGVGQHLDYLLVNDPEAIVNWAKCGYAIEEIYCAAVAFPKLSILASYLRIFTGRAYRVITYAVGGIITATMIAGIITSVASCHPFDARWNLDLFASRCINAVVYWRGMSAPNITTDVIMLFLPMPVVWNLHVSRKQKLALSAVFLLGSFGIISSCIRLAVTVRMHSLSDGTYDSARIATWLTVESGCYLVAACLPTLRPFFASIGKLVVTMVVKSQSSSPPQHLRCANYQYSVKYERRHLDDDGRRSSIPLALWRICDKAHRKHELKSDDKNWIFDGQSARVEEERGSVSSV